MDVIRANPGVTHTFPGMWALLRTILDDDGDAARAEVAALRVDTPVSRVAGARRRQWPPVGPAAPTTPRH